ncbi:MAG: IMP dehydrogenase [Rectinemataceae bacterium]|nr:IMP dehydrogenase [Rectinemataceae bacterium]
MNEEIFGSSTALTFDDVLIVPAFSEILPAYTDTKARIARDIILNIPLLSAAMDTVTESALAIALARMGGMGVIHRNMSPEQQAGEVDKVKRSESGMILDPVCLEKDASLSEARGLMEKFRISGIPITSGPEKKLVGILTNRDIRFCAPEDYEKPVSAFMTSERLITARVGTTLEQARNILQEHRIEKLPLTDEKGRLKGLITVKDIAKKADYPNASLDSSGRLRAAAAVGVGPDLEQRIELLAAKKVDVLVIDTAHGHSKGVIEALKRIKAVAPDLPVIAGNVVTAEGVEALARAGADAVKIGVGAGSICTTRIISGAGMPQLSAIYHCAQAAARFGIPVIADGGVKFSGDMVKSIAAGAHAIMLGSLLAGLEESPGELVLYNGRQYKTYRGMGSLAALQGYGKDRYATGIGASDKLVPEGVEGMVPYKGKLADFVYQLVGGLRSGCGYAGAANLDELRTKTRFVRITNAGLIESHAHNITITREAPNYQRGE